MTADTYSNTLGYLIMGTGNDNNTWGSNANTAVFQIFEDAIANTLSSAVTGGTLDLSGSPPPAAASGARYAGLIFTGVLGSNQVVQVPNLSKWWFVKNATSGAFTLKFKTSAGSASTAIPQNSGWQIIYCDGADGIVVWPDNTKQIQLPDGTVALPAYSNINEPSSGWFRFGTQDWRLSINGVAVLQCTGTGAGTPSVINVLSPNSLQVAGNPILSNGAVIKAADGTVGAPGFAFNSEATSGWYRSAAGIVSFAILGVLRATITATDFTWIGATYAGTDLSPAAISSDQNNYNPTNLNTATCIRLNFTSTASITGMAGGAAGREVEYVNVGTATGKFPANSASSTAANRYANTFNLAPGQSITLRYDATSSLWRPKNVATAFSSCGMAAVSNDLLVVNHSGTENTLLDITASEATLVDASGNAIKFENIAVDIDSTTTGPGGCDTGTRAASTSYFEWLISDGVNIDAVISTSATFATVLSNLTASSAAYANYIYGKRIGWQRTNSSSNFQRIRTMGRRSQYVVSSATTTALPNIVTTVGTVGSVTTPTWTALAVSAANPLTASFVPTTAIAISLVTWVDPGSNANVNIAVAPNTSYGGVNSTTNPPPIFNQGITAGMTGSPTRIDTMMLESSNIQYATSGIGHIQCLGWEDTI